MLQFKGHGAIPGGSKALGRLRRFFGGVSRSVKRRTREEAAAKAASGDAAGHDTPEGTRRQNASPSHSRHVVRRDVHDNADDDTDYDTASEGVAEALLKEVLEGGDAFGEERDGRGGYYDRSVEEVPSTSHRAIRSSFDGVLPRATEFIMPSTRDSETDEKHISPHWSSDVEVLEWLKVRGPGYLTQKKKQTPAVPVMECVHVDLFSLDDHVDDVSDVRPESWLNRQRDAWTNARSKSNNEQSTSLSHRPWTFVFQFQNPGPPVVSICCYFQPTGSRAGMNLPQLLKHELGTPFGKCLSRFLNADDATRNSKFKMVCALLDAPWALRAAVPRRPIILGKKLGRGFGLKYFQSSDHFEIDFELGQNKFMERVYRSLKWASALSSEEIVFMIEGQDVDELPEVVLGAVSLKKISEKAFTKLPPLVEVNGLSGSSHGLEKLSLDSSPTRVSLPTSGGGG